MVGESPTPSSNLPLCRTKQAIQANLNEWCMGFLMALILSLRGQTERVKVTLGPVPTIGRRAEKGRAPSQPRQ